MMTTNPSPWLELDRLQRQLNDVFGRRGMARDATEFPPINIWTNDEGAVITAELPGLDAKQIDLSVPGDTLTLKGERAEQKSEPGHTFHRRERGSGPFARTVQVAFRIEPAGVTATYERGVLEVTVPRSKADRPRSIAVTTG